MWNTSGIFAISKAAVQGSEIEKKITNLIHDDSVQAISSFELNQIASLTYHESSIADGIDLCEKIFQILLSVVSKPLIYNALTLQKALVVSKHCILVGAERAIQEAMILGKHVEQLQSYNTVLIAQQQQGATGMFMRLKGGGVDTGGPVREVSQQIIQLLVNRDFLALERAKHADPTSLVPIGERNKLAFATDQVRLDLLKQRMEHQHRMQIKSNLAKADGGWGGGYNSKDGSNVVGAAHSLDEMIKIAQRKEQIKKSRYSDNKGFSDSGESEGYRPPTASWDQDDLLSSRTEQSQPTQEPDLFSFDDVPVSQVPAPSDSMDLLGLGGAGNAGASADLLSTAYSDVFSSPPAHYPTAATPTIAIIPPSTALSNHGAASSFSTDLLCGLPAAPAPSNTSSGQPGSFYFLGTTPSPVDLLGSASPAKLNMRNIGELPSKPVPADTFDPGSGSAAAKLPDAAGGIFAGMMSGLSVEATEVPPSVNHASSLTPSVTCGPIMTAAGHTTASSILGMDATVPQKAYVMNSSVERFSALDALGVAPGSATVGHGHAAVAESRILGSLAGNDIGLLGSLPASFSLHSAMPPQHQPPPHSVAASGMTPPSLPPPLPLEPPPPPVVATQEQLRMAYNSTSLKVSDIPVPGGWNAEDNDENGFVMGGSTGTGLEPLGAAPAAPPPLPPPGGL